MGDEKLNELTEAILGCAFRVHNELGCGFLKKVYENALVIECRLAGLLVRQQVPLHVHFRGEVVGDYTADVVVADTVLVELKSAKAIDDIHQAQCLNYLRATRKPVCLLLNFGAPRLQIKRMRL